MVSDPPVLYHLAISPYSEKARWAFSYKGVRHIRRGTTGGLHVALSLALTRGESYTLPVLKMDGQTIADSTRIIEALEEAHPDPPLYPADHAERERALALEDWLDEEVGTAIRRFAFAELSREPEALGSTVGLMMPEPFASAPRLAAAIGKPFVWVRYGAGPQDAAEEARNRALDACDRLEDELGGGDYLVGDSFTVADLTGASVLYPAVRPSGAPQLPPPPERLEAFRQELEGRRAVEWAREMYARHRGAP